MIWICFSGTVLSTLLHWKQTHSPGMPNVNLVVSVLSSEISHFMATSKLVMLSGIWEISWCCSSKSSLKCGTSFRASSVLLDSQRNWSVFTVAFSYTLKGFASRLRLDQYDLESLALLLPGPDANSSSSSNIPSSFFTC